MDVFTNSVPQWVSLLFLVSILIPIFMLSRVLKQGGITAKLETTFVSKLVIGTFIFFLTYYFYVACMCWSGFFLINTIPPRILLFTTLPLLLFYFVFISRTQVYQTLLNAIPLSALVRLHVFRLVGVFFLIVWRYDALPTYFAFSAGLGDIFAALTAIVVAKCVDKSYKHYKTITVIWNVIGLCDIFNVLFTALYLTKQNLETGSQGVIDITGFPFALIPAFAPATIIFWHIAIFKKLKLEK